MMRGLIVILFSLFLSLLPLTAQENELPLAYLLREDNTPIALFSVWADNQHDSAYAGGLPGEFGFRQNVSWDSVGVVRFGVDFAIGDYALSPDRTRMAFSAYDPADVTASDGHVYRGNDYGLFIYHIGESQPSSPVIERIDIDHPVDVIWSPEGEALLLRAVGVEGFPSPFYSSEPDTLIYDLTAKTFSTLQAGDPAVFYTDGYDAELDVEGKAFFFSATQPYVWLPDGRIVFQSGGIDCGNDCTSWNDLYMADRNGSKLQRLTILAEQLPNQSNPRIKAAVWSAIDERLYITIGNNDDTQSALYSLNLNGDFRTEALDNSSGNSLPVQPVMSRRHHYVTVYKSGAGWAIRQLEGAATDATTIYQSDVFADFPSIDAYSPDGKLAAVNTGTVTRVVDLDKGEISMTLETGMTCGLRWLDEQNFIYQQVGNALDSLAICPEETEGLWRADVDSGILTDLTERFLKPVRLLLVD